MKERSNMTVSLQRVESPCQTECFSKFCMDGDEDTDISRTFRFTIETPPESMFGRDPMILFLKALITRQKIFKYCGIFFFDSERPCWELFDEISRGARLAENNFQLGIFVETGDMSLSEVDPHLSLEEVS